MGTAATDVVGQPCWIRWRGSEPSVTVEIFTDGARLAARAAPTRHNRTGLLARVARGALPADGWPLWSITDPSGSVELLEIGALPGQSRSDGLHLAARVTSGGREVGRLEPKSAYSRVLTTAEGVTLTYRPVGEAGADITDANGALVAAVRGYRQTPASLVPLDGLVSPEDFGFLPGAGASRDAWAVGLAATLLAVQVRAYEPVGYQSYLQPRWTVPDGASERTARREERSRHSGARRERFLREHPDFAARREQKRG